MKIEYKPGYAVTLLRDPADVAVVTIDVDPGLIDEDTGEPLGRTSHFFEYRWTSPDGPLGWRRVRKKNWNQTLSGTLFSVEEVIYDAVLQFETHELQHFLKVNGRYVRDPHDPHSTTVQPDELGLHRKAHDGS